MTKKTAHARATPPLRGGVWLVAAVVPWLVLTRLYFLYEGWKDAGDYYVVPELVAFSLPVLASLAMIFLDGPPARLQAHFSAREVVAGRWRVMGPKWPGLPAQLGAVGLVVTVGVLPISVFTSHHAGSLSYLLALGVVLFCNRWRLTPPATLERASTGYRGHALRLRAGTTERPVELLRADAARGEVRLVDRGRTEVWVVLGPCDDLFALAEEIAPPPQTPAIPTGRPKR